MVTGFMSLLKDRCQGKLDAKADEYIDFASDGAARMQRLIDDLLAYSRAGRGAMTERTDMGAVLESVLENLTASIEESGAAITHDPLPTITCQPDGTDAGLPEPDRQRHQVPGAADAGDPRRRPAASRTAGCSRSATTASASIRSLRTGSS